LKREGGGLSGSAQYLVHKHSRAPFDNGNSFTKTGLRPATTYQVQVRDGDALTWTEWSTPPKDEKTGVQALVEALIRPLKLVDAERYLPLLEQAETELEAAHDAEAGEVPSAEG
jgi:hypothetical protein